MNWRRELVMRTTPADKEHTAAPTAVRRLARERIRTMMRMNRVPVSGRSLPGPETKRARGRPVANPVSDDSVSLSGGQAAMVSSGALVPALAGWLENELAPEPKYTTVGSLGLELPPVREATM